MRGDGMNQKPQSVREHGLDAPEADELPEEGRTVDTREQGDDPHGEETPKLPHEHDESVGSTGGVPSPEMQQAHADQKRGLVDTDRGPVSDQTYRRLKN